MKKSLKFKIVNSVTNVLFMYYGLFVYHNISFVSLEKTKSTIQFNDTNIDII